MRYEPTATLQLANICQWHARESDRQTPASARNTARFGIRVSAVDPLMCSRHGSFSGMPFVAHNPLDRSVFLGMPCRRNQERQKHEAKASRLPNTPSSSCAGRQMSTATRCSSWNLRSDVRFTVYRRGVGGGKCGTPYEMSCAKSL